MQTRKRSREINSNNKNHQIQNMQISILGATSEKLNTDSQLILQQ